MVGVSASVNLPLHHKVQKLSSGTDSHAGIALVSVQGGCVSVCSAW